MARPEPEMATTCARCGKPFNTSRQHPRKYCSIACEEGRAPRAMSDPQSEDYHLFLKGKPEALVGRTIIANGLKRVDYSPDWTRNPEDYANGTIVSHDDEEEVFVRKHDIVLGTVVEYDGHYTIEHEDIETGEITTRRIKDMLVVDQIRQDRWWVE